jgi:hypothetical protein
MVVQRKDEWTEPPLTQLIISLASESKPSYLPVMGGGQESYDWEFEPDFDDGLTGTTSLGPLEPSESPYKESDILYINHSSMIPVKYMINSPGSKTIKHVQFHGWPKYSVPKGAARVALIELARKVPDYMTYVVDYLGDPPIIHCGAGCGRTGTFIALTWLLGFLDSGGFDVVSDNKDHIFEVVSLLRQQRRSMVETQAQFQFLYDVLREQWTERNKTSPKGSQ